MELKGFLRHILLMLVDGGETKSWFPFYIILLTFLYIILKVNLSLEILSLLISPYRACAGTYTVIALSDCTMYTVQVLYILYVVASPLWTVSENHVAFCVSLQSCLTLTRIRGCVTLSGAWWWADTSPGSPSTGSTRPRSSGTSPSRRHPRLSRKKPCL